MSRRQNWMGRGRAREKEGENTGAEPGGRCQRIGVTKGKVGCRGGGRGDGTAPGGMEFLGESRDGVGFVEITKTKLEGCRMERRVMRSLTDLWVMSMQTENLIYPMLLCFKNGFLQYRMLILLTGKPLI